SLLIDLKGKDADALSSASLHLLPGPEESAKIRLTQGFRGRYKSAFSGFSHQTIHIHSRGFTHEQD
ncbi:MAG: hypothetical protein LWW83_12235, partial [Azonexaceae bacterium]|nr:hypothetical protein [Azonexaceae bacterium]